MDSPVPTSRIAARDRIYRCDAIVLRRMDLGETDRILTILTDRFGKIRVIAKGIRRPTARLGAHLELFAKTRLMLSRGRDLDVITAAETLDLHVGLRASLNALGVASHCAELVDRFLEDRDEHREVYLLLSNVLSRLGETDKPEAVGRWFELALLGEMGVRPELFRCVACGSPVEEAPNRFSVRLGGILCAGHQESDSSAQVLSVAAQKVLRHIVRSDLASFLQLTMSETVQNEIEAVLSAFLKHQLERELNSLKVMRRVEESLPRWDDYKSTK